MAPDRRFLNATIMGWPLAVSSALAGRAAFVSPGLSPVELAGWVFLGCAPVAIALAVARGGATSSVAQVLYDAEHVDDHAPTVPVTVPRG